MLKSDYKFDCKAAKMRILWGNLRQEMLESQFSFFDFVVTSAYRQCSLKYWYGFDTISSLKTFKFFFFQFASIVYAQSLSIIRKKKTSFNDWFSLNSCLFFFFLSRTIHINHQRKNCARYAREQINSIKFQLKHIHLIWMDPKMKVNKKTQMNLFLEAYKRKSN